MFDDDYKFTEEELQAGIAKTEEALKCEVVTFAPAVVEVCRNFAEIYEIEFVADGAGASIVLGDLRNIHRDMILDNCDPREIDTVVNEINQFVWMAVAEVRTDVPAWQEQYGVGMNS